MSAPKLLSQAALRALREDLFRLELTTLRELIDHGLEPGRIALIADTAKTIETIQQLQPPTRDR